MSRAFYVAGVRSRATRTATPGSERMMDDLEVVA
jgi:hypothetical protein